MLTTTPFTTGISPPNNRARGYIEELNEITRRCQERGVDTLGGIVDYEPEREPEPVAASLVYPPFVLLDEQPEPVLEYPAFERDASLPPSVATFEEQLQDLAALRRLAEAA
ncbi:MAG: hypothetical protein U0166_00770 [Acidobacteriota bacterium]